jgi:hypothetical protein
MSGTRFCVHCDQPIIGPAEPVEPIESGSGVHPTVYRHPECRPATAPYVRRSPR